MDDGGSTGSAHDGAREQGREKRYRISTVVDELNQRYGQNAVYFGGIHSVLEAAPTRISFSTIPDVEDF